MSASSNDPETMHPAYFTTRFRSSDLPLADWHDEFVILSAFATTGESWTEEENEAADDALRRKLVQRGLRFARVTGYDPETGHAEPSYAVTLTLPEARELGRLFHQDAIFHVSGDALSVTRCILGDALVPVGSFREKLD